MMIVQSTPGSRVPVPSPVFPVQYAEAGATWSLSQWEAEFARIPLVIRQEFISSLIDESGDLVRFGYRVGSVDWLVTGEGRWPGFSASYGALYETGQATDLHMTSKRVAVRSDQPVTLTLVHEFGHHIDTTFHRFRGEPWAPNSALRHRAPFAATWQTVSPSIPSALYGATNVAEWIAEQWRCQIHGDGATFLQLMGGSRSAADTIRAEWVSMFPTMPAFSY
ncbi:hypothetical protein [Microbacterium rhizomatis]|uniref:Uncharacterized protein n=1 Tax=Microbacterium rhizomatis TaxID=1631477 RepID=A0A5J5J2A6_9MICO|nr:hypothetical protein [Microbacterium rhizomatis]KAA9110190.1 hypothetical protein F6B43_00320 [Microbacterium rhizomatis]